MAEPIHPTKRIADTVLGSGGMFWRTANDGFEEAASKIRRVAQGSNGAELVDAERSLRECAATWLNKYLGSWSDAKIRWDKTLAVAAAGEELRAREQRQEFFDGLKGCVQRFAGDSIKQITGAYGPGPGAVATQPVPARIQQPQWGSLPSLSRRFLEPYRAHVCGVHVPPLSV